MASGLQCPGCGHVHPAGLPEIVRGDATFRCYGCYRTLSIPDGWTGRPAPRPAPAPVPTADAPPGAGLRDARAARLANRRRARSDTRFDETQMSPLTGAGAGTDWPDGGVRSPGPDWADGGAGAATGAWPAAGGAGAPGADWPSGGADAATGAWPAAGGAGAPGAEWPDGGAGAAGSDWPAGPGGAPDWRAGAAGAPAPNWPAAGATGAWAGPAGTAAPGSAGVAGARTPAGGSSGGLAGGRPGTAGGVGGLAGARGATAGAEAGPLGWVAPRRSGRPVPAAARAAVWVAAFVVGLFISAYLLRKVGLLDVNTAIDLFAGTGPRRFGILVVMLPLWALLSAGIAHLSIEALTRRRRPRPSRPTRPSPTRTTTHN